MRPSLRCCSGFVLLFLLAWLAACANVRPLEGGPPDTTPPSLLASTPVDSTVALGPNPVLHLRFSESLNTSSLRTGLRTYPSLPRPEVRVKGGHVEVRYVDSLPPDTTLVLVLGRGIQDAPGRDNGLPAEIWLVYATGESLQSGEVFGRITVKGKPEAQTAVQYQPWTTEASESTAARPKGPRPRLPTAACDGEGLFQLRGLPVQRAFQLRAFVDRNANLEPDEEELQAVYPETLQLATGQVLRGLQWNLVDPNEPGVVTGIAFNSTDVTGPIAVMLVALDPPPEPMAALPGRLPATLSGAAPDTTDRASTARHAVAGQEPGVASVDSLVPDRSTMPPGESTGVALDGGEPVRSGASAVAAPGERSTTPLDSLASRLPVSSRGAWDAAYTALALPDSAGLRRVVYASARGDYSVRVRPGRHQLLAFVDASGDSLPGTHVSHDSSRLDWEPLWVGGILEVSPGAEVRPRAIDIDAPR